ncbi:uncharacterized protein BCN122_III0140 [Burkholderia cenocepacia]|nr:uncharacterized protein BCN122_III0140 [Burkholderia cenocepacia]
MPPCAARRRLPPNRRRADFRLRISGACRYRGGRGRAAHRIATASGAPFPGT